MPISVSCSCGKPLSVPDKFAGKRIKCPACQQPLDVPAAAASPPITVRCACQQSIKVPSHLAGKTVKCPHCGQPVRVAASTTSAPAASPPPVASDIGALLDEIGFQRAASPHRCPNCKADMSEEAILCVQCGYHLETGKVLETKVVRRRK